MGPWSWPHHDSDSHEVPRRSRQTGEMDRRDTSLQGAFDVPGRFWLPKRSDDAIPGRLSCQAGRIELELFGSFGRPLTRDDLSETDLILGYTEAGRCTLANCIRIQGRSKILSDFDLAHSTWMANASLSGSELRQGRGHGLLGGLPSADHGPRAASEHPRCADGDRPNARRAAERGNTGKLQTPSIALGTVS
jgi:hypothetical protein